MELAHNKAGRLPLLPWETIPAVERKNRDAAQ
jgi:hypothetical protein